jgi:hypothetical protein
MKSCVSQLWKAILWWIRFQTLRSHRWWGLSIIMRRNCTNYATVLRRILHMLHPRLCTESIISYYHKKLFCLENLENSFRTCCERILKWLHNMFSIKKCVFINKHSFPLSYFSSFLLNSEMKCRYYNGSKMVFILKLYYYRLKY